MNRKQRRAKASMAKKAIHPWLMKQVEFAQREAGLALWAILGKFDIKEAKNRWFMYGGFRSGKSNHIYNPSTMGSWLHPSK